jgi:hypothetical protein
MLLQGLDRELGKANNPWIRLPRKIQGHVASHVPFISNPAFDSRVLVRHTILRLLDKLDADLRLATPPIARAMRDDNLHVRSMAIEFFITPVIERDWEVRLNRMVPDQRQKLLDEFIRAVRAPQPLRSTAAFALGFYVIIQSIEHFAKIRPDLVIPALQQVAQREDEIGRQAAAALERLESDEGSTTIEQP